MNSDMAGISLKKLKKLKVIDFRLSGCVNLSGKGIAHIINEF